ncbi:MAG: hypothetical protein HC880_08390 [Bacteroidia bacterium]|nr:hypothetical protein [Bacteroidia bacterium]
MALAGNAPIPSIPNILRPPGKKIQKLTPSPLLIRWEPPVIGAFCWPINPKSQKIILISTLAGCNDVGPHYQGW